MLAAALENGGRDNVTLIIVQVADDRPDRTAIPLPRCTDTGRVHAAESAVEGRLQAWSPRAVEWCGHGLPPDRHSRRARACPAPAAAVHRRSRPCRRQASCCGWSTGSLYALCFAALGPLMIAASLSTAPARRRRDRRRERCARQTHGRGAAEESSRARQRGGARARCGIVIRMPPRASTQPPLRGTDRRTPHRARGRTRLGARAASAAAAATGERARDVPRAVRSARTNAPRRGWPSEAACALRGRTPLVAAVARALVAAAVLCGSARAAGARAATGSTSWASRRSPHARVGSSRRPSGSASLAPGDAASARRCRDLVLPRDADVPEGITTVIDVIEPRVRVRADAAGCRHEVAVEALSSTQAVRSRATGGRRRGARGAPACVALDELAQRTGERGLPAAIGRSAQREDASLDIVEDGPHAIVTGTTGTGKSELLVTWVTAIAPAHGPDRVVVRPGGLQGRHRFRAAARAPAGRGGDHRSR